MSHTKSDPSERSSDSVEAEVALQRAALRAKEEARIHGTAIVTSEDGVLKYEYPGQEDKEPKE